MVNMRRTFVAGLSLQAAAFTFVVVAYAQRNDFSVEGVYINRSVGPEAGSSQVSAAATNGRWLVAAAVLVAASLACFVADARRAQSR